MISQLLSHYSGVPVDQRQTVAEQFINAFKGKQDPQSQQFSQMNPAQVTPQQLADMHQHAAQQHPDVLQRVEQHPVAAAAMAGLGAYMIDKHLGDQQEHR